MGTSRLVRPLTEQEWIGLCDDGYGAIDSPTKHFVFFPEAVTRIHATMKHGFAGATSTQPITAFDLEALARQSAADLLNDPGTPTEIRAGLIERILDGV